MGHADALSFSACVCVCKCECVCCVYVRVCYGCVSELGAHGYVTRSMGERCKDSKQRPCCSLSDHTPEVYRSIVVNVLANSISACNGKQHVSTLEHPCN